MDGYSVNEAAAVLGIPEGRVWELLARGVLGKHLTLGLLVPIERHVDVVVGFETSVDAERFLECVEHSHAAENQRQ